MDFKDTIVILASASPRRRELLGKIIPDFDIITKEVSEDLPDGILPKEGVRLLAVRKGAAVVSKELYGALIISSDTLVELDGKPLGKPADKDDAVNMLQNMSERTHFVRTGIAVHYKGKVYSDTASSAVTFKKLTEEQIRNYVDSGEPMDKAGSYGIQGGAALFCTRMVGDYYNVMGLPVCRLGQVLREMAPDLMGDML